MTFIMSPILLWVDILFLPCLFVCHTFVSATLQKTTEPNLMKLCRLLECVMLLCLLLGIYDPLIFVVLIPVRNLEWKGDIHYCRQQQFNSVCLCVNNLTNLLNILLILWSIQIKLF